MSQMRTAAVIRETDLTQIHVRCGRGRNSLIARSQEATNPK